MAITLADPRPWPLREPRLNLAGACLHFRSDSVLSFVRHDRNLDFSCFVSCRSIRALLTVIDKVTKLGLREQA